jgi:hypothetical protein
MENERFLTSAKYGKNNYFVFFKTDTQPHLRIVEADYGQTVHTVVLDGLTLGDAFKVAFD